MMTTRQTDNRIDLRSDTVTKPTPEMREAMRNAMVGDDVFMEDPTVNQLEEETAKALGKEAALFTPSGTMANLIALLTHCGRGDEVILGDQAHIFFYEQGGSAAMGGIHPRTVPNTKDGMLDLDYVEAAVRDNNIHYPISRLIAVENTQNRCSGSPIGPQYLTELRKLADGHGLKIHTDGARIFNAATALGVSAAELAETSDSISCCLSKGLAAPVGSLICGDKEFIRKARRNRKVLGGGMRQAGVLAAAGLIALNVMTKRLSEDHQNAKKLAAGLSQTKGIEVDPDFIKTNIIYFHVDKNMMTAKALSEKLKENGVLINSTAPQSLRAVTHYGITENDIDKTLEVFRSVMK